jgi:hypothetical protein
LEEARWLRTCTLTGAVLFFVVTLDVLVFYVSTAKTYCLVSVDPETGTKSLGPTFDSQQEADAFATAVGNSYVEFADPLHLVKTF